MTDTQHIRIIVVDNRSQRASQPDYGLSDREREVLTLLVEGLSNAEIADEVSSTQIYSPEG